MNEPGIVVWFTGLPASGKSTVASAVREALRVRGREVCFLDGDEVRRSIAVGLGFDAEGRALFYGIVAGVAGLLARQGHIVLVAATAHLRAHRSAARAAAPRFLEVYVATPPQVCRARDPKGIYAAVRRGEISDVPGVDADYEVPRCPDVIIGGACSSPAVERIAELATQRCLARTDRHDSAW